MCSDNKASLVVDYQHLMTSFPILGTCLLVSACVDDLEDLLTCASVIG